MGFKGFALSYVAVDPLDDFDENSENFEEESEFATPFPGYLVGGSEGSKFSHKKTDDDDDDENAGEDDDEDVEESELKKPDDKDLDEDLVTDNEDNFIYNSNRIGKENAEILETIKKKKDEKGES
jgi:hypothetical protein